MAISEERAVSNTISTAFPYQSHFVKVNNSQLHYIKEGSGKTVLFLHGVPTWSYLWRNIIPYLSEHGQCIAVDLIGFGLSDKPDIKYDIFDHIAYIEGFIEKLALKDITLVMHGWGSVIGFHLAMKYPEKFSALAFFEAHVRAVENWDMLSLPLQEIASVLIEEDGGYNKIINENYYIDNVLVNGILRRLDEKELEQYQKPFTTPESRQAIWQYLCDLPLYEPDPEVVALIKDYSQKLTQSLMPKLMLYAIPGFITTMETVVWAKTHLSNLTLVDIDDALHYAQESNPEEIGLALQKWFLALKA